MEYKLEVIEHFRNDGTVDIPDDADHVIMDNTGPHSVRISYLVPAGEDE